MNYIFYEFKTSQVCTIQENKKTYHNCLSLFSFFNEKCLMHGSSLKGRQEAFMYQMKIKKFVPIVVSISKQEIYFPDKPKKAHDCFWINYANIKNVTYFSDHCIIYFKDDSSLTCMHPKRIQHSIQLIFRYIKKNTPE